jgi:NADPH-dependent 7-cyano-7-deazaguanine reductase QueF-like protein
MDCNSEVFETKNVLMNSHALKPRIQLKTIRINKGSLDGVEVGQIYDIFNLTKSGAPHIAIARAIVSESKTNESQLTLRFYFREIWIEEGFIAKKVVQ